MYRKRKWLLFSLALICGLALSLTMFSSDQGTAKKLPRAIKEICDLYRDMGVQKLSQATAALKKLGSQKVVNKLWGEDRPVKGHDPKKTSSINKLDRLVLPELQKRWDNPSFDVVRGYITASSNPKALESPYLKIRRAWKRNGTWKAFCEFALFKAEEIANQAPIIRLGMAPAPKLENDLGSASTGAPRLRYGVPGDWDRTRGYTGNNVVVGDVDTGIDWTHGDFLNPDGTTRILYLWDTTVNTTYDKTPAGMFGMSGGIYVGFDFGTVYTKEDIDHGLCPEVDTNGHGTHTIGTAAGNGGATGLYTGMAPNADIIFVKGLQFEGNEFIFERAASLGKPVAVNNSWGYDWPGDLYAGYPYCTFIIWYPGDGSDYESDYIDYLAEIYPRGAIFVNSAGNDGHWPYSFIHHKEIFDYSYGWPDGGEWHAGGTTRASSVLSHRYHRPAHPEMFGLRSEYSDFWVRSNKPVRVTVKTAVKTYTFDTGTYGNFDDAYSANTDFDMDMMDDNGNGEYCGYINFDEYTADAGWGEGDWTIKVRPLNGGLVKYDLWMQSYHGRWGDVAHTHTHNYWDACFAGVRGMVDYSEYILDFGAGKNVYTVGAWTTRSEWLAADGYTYYPWGFVEPYVGAISIFSSPGPSRDGRMKPDIAAPGAVIMSAASKDAGWEDYDLDPDLAHGWMWGTSMAAPHATGAIALLLQRYPNLPMSAVRYYLKQWAKKDNFTRRFGVKGFGAGKLNVLPLKNR